MSLKPGGAKDGVRISDDARLHGTVDPSVALALGGMIAMAVGVGVGRFVYTPILPVMVTDLGLSAGEAGLIASANFLGYLAGALVAAARLPGSRRGWLFGALAVSVVTTGGMSLTTSLAAFLAVRFVAGVASAFILVFASALVLDRLSAAGRSGLSALHFAGVGVGIALSAAVVSALLIFGSDWRWLWLASAAVSLAGAVVVGWLVPESRDERAAAPTAGDRSRGRGLVALVSAYGLFGFGYVITATFLVAIVRASPSIRDFEPLVWILVGLAAVPSVAFWTWLGRRVGVAGAFAAGCLVEAAGVAASVLWLTPVGTALAAAFLGGTFMGITALGLIGARELSGSDPRRTLAIMTAAFGLGQIMGPLLAGLVHDQLGSFLVPSLAAAGALIAAAFLTLRVRVPKPG